MAHQNPTYSVRKDNASDDLADRIAREITIEMEGDIIEWSADRIKTHSTPSSIDAIAKEFQDQIKQRASKETASWIAWQVGEEAFMDGIAQRTLSETTKMVNKLEQEYAKFKDECDCLKFRIQYDANRHRYEEARIERDVEREWKTKMEENKKMWMDEAMKYAKEEDWVD